MYQVSLDICIMLHFGMEMFKWELSWKVIKCNTAQNMKFSIKDFFSKCDQIRSFLRIWSHLLKKSLKENFIFDAV